MAITNSDSLTSKSITRKPHGIPYMLAMGIMTAGHQSVDFITGNMLPITLRHFTDSTFFIGFMVGLNRLFGFLVQPYVSWKSDSTQTRYGRRRPFLMLGLPVTMFFLLCLGAMPFLFQGESRFALSTLLLLVLIGICMQAFQDVNGGCDELLYVDSFGTSRLGRAIAVRSFCAQSIVYFMLNVSMKWADQNEFYPYLTSAGLLLISTLIVIFIIREAHVTRLANKESYTLFKHLGLFKNNRDYQKLAIIGTFGFLFSVAFDLFLPLYAIETIGLSKGLYGEALQWGPIIILIITFPIGYLIDRLGPKHVLAFSFLICIFASLGMLFFVHDFQSLRLACAIKTTGVQLYWQSIIPMVMLYAPEHERGRINGLIQLVRALMGFIASLAIGKIAQMADNYLVSYAVAFSFAVTALWATVVMRRPSHCLIHQ